MPPSKVSSETLERETARPMASSARRSTAAPFTGTTSGELFGARARAVAVADEGADAMRHDQRPDQEQPPRPDERRGRAGGERPPPAAAAPRPRPPRPPQPIADAQTPARR